MGAPASPEPVQSSDARSPVPAQRPGPAREQRGATPSAALRRTDFAGGATLLSPAGGPPAGGPVQLAKAPTTKAAPASAPPELSSAALGSGAAVVKVHVALTKAETVLKLATHANFPRTFFAVWYEAYRAAEKGGAGLADVLVKSSRQMLGELEQWLASWSSKNPSLAGGLKVAYQRVVPALQGIQRDAAGALGAPQLGERAVAGLGAVMDGLTDVLSGTEGLAAALDKSGKDLSQHAAGADFSAIFGGTLSGAASANRADLVRAPAAAKKTLEQVFASTLPVRFMYTEKGGAAHLYLIGVAGPTRLVASAPTDARHRTASGRQAMFGRLLDAFLADNAWLPKGRLAVTFGGQAVKRQVAVTKWWRELHTWVTSGGGIWVNHVLFWLGVAGMALATVATAGGALALAGSALLAGTALGGTMVTALDLYAKHQDEQLGVKDAVVGLSTVLGYMTGVGAALLGKQTALLARAEQALASAQPVPWWAVSRLSERSLAFARGANTLNNWVTLTVGRAGYVLTTGDVVAQGQRLLAEKRYAEFAYHLLVTTVGHGMYVVGNRQAFDGLKRAPQDRAAAKATLGLLNELVTVGGQRFPAAKVAEVTQRLQGMVKAGAELTALTRVTQIDGVPVRVKLDGRKPLSAAQRRDAGVSAPHAARGTVSVFLGRADKVGTIAVVYGGGTKGAARVLKATLRDGATPGEVIARKIARTQRDVPVGEHGFGGIVAINKQHVKAQAGGGAPKQEPAPGKGAGAAPKQEPAPGKGAGGAPKQEPAPGKGAGGAPKQEPAPGKPAGKAKAGPAAANKNAGFTSGPAGAGEKEGKTLDAALNGDDAAVKRLAHLVTSYAHARRLLVHGVRQLLGYTSSSLDVSYVRPDVSPVTRTKLGTLPEPTLLGMLQRALEKPAKAALRGRPSDWPAGLFQPRGDDVLAPALAHVLRHSAPSEVWTEVVGPSGPAGATEAQRAALETALLGFQVQPRLDLLSREVSLAVMQHGMPLRRFLPR